MPAGRGNLEGALGGFVALDIAKIEAARIFFADFGGGWRQTLRTLEMIDEGKQRGRRQNLDPVRPGRLGPASLRADDAAALRRSRKCGGQHPGNRGDRPIEGQFAQRRLADDLVPRQNAETDQQADRDRQIEMAAFLEQIGGARLTVIRFGGRARPSAPRAARTRSRDSAPALSGKPTMVKAGSPGETPLARRCRRPRSPGMRPYSPARPCATRPRFGP